MVTLSQTGGENMGTDKPDKRTLTKLHSYPCESYPCEKHPDEITEFIITISIHCWPYGINDVLECFYVTQPSLVARGYIVLTIRVKPLTARIGVSTACGQQSHEQVDWLPCQAAYLIRPRRVWFFGRGDMSSTSRNQDGTTTTTSTPSRARAPKSRGLILEAYIEYSGVD